jgi:aldehyde dehydrogenase (NAD+)/betaine-aldehyde dehydrogenase
MVFSNTVRVIDQLYIGGGRRRATGEVRSLPAPATELAHATLTCATPAESDAAVAAACEAAGDWQGLETAHRAALVAAMGEHLRRGAESLARDFAVEIGTPFGVSQGLHVDPALHVFAAAPRLAVRAAAIESIEATAVRRMPLGVALCITPWNYPLYQIASKIVPAMVAGMTVVLKPSELAPRSLDALIDAAQAVALPPGVLNVVFGDAEIGRRLVTHADIDVVSFTGSTAIGREVAAAAGSALKKVSLELGGKSAGILLRDGDLQAAVRLTVAKCYQNAGQTCAALSRLLVPRACLDAAAALAVEAASEYRCGDPFARDTTLGPVISGAQREKIRAMIDRALNAGALLLTGGAERPRQAPRGFFLAPTIFRVASAAAEIAREEVFGPVLTLLGYEHEDEAVAIANGTPYGLAAAVWSEDLGHADRVARRLRAGSVSLNGARTHPDAPFGGFGASGWGRERGVAALDAYLGSQAVHR